MPFSLKRARARNRRLNGRVRTNKRRRLFPTGGQVAPFAGPSAKADTVFRMPLFQDSKRVTLRYVEDVLSVTGTTGAVGGYVFSANGLFDPNITGTGHQPMGFDQMMLLYEQATVIASKISFTVYNASSAGVHGLVCAYLSPDTTVLTSFARTLENGTAKYKLLAPINTPGSFVENLSLACDIRTYFGRSRSIPELISDVTLCNTSAANPTEQVYYILIANDALTGTNTVVLDFIVNIEYDVVFWEPRKLTQS